MIIDKKDFNINIRISKKQYDRFVFVCKTNYLKPSKVIRLLMQNYSYKGNFLTDDNK